MTELERYKTALQKIAAHMRGNWSHEWVEGTVREALNPPPEFETVEVVRWTFGDGCDTFATGEEARENATHSGDVYSLTGYRKRPKPQKVERSASVEDIRLNDFGRPLYNISPVIEFTEASGKTGTLTFTWTE